jgi:hypothetical protein
LECVDFVHSLKAFLSVPFIHSTQDTPSGYSECRYGPMRFQMIEINTLVARNGDPCDEGT